jgi:mutator protein MutT
MKPHIEVAAGIILHDGLLLISQRNQDSHLAGYWEFPGGKRKSGETFEACLQRELLEELNILVEVGRLFEELTYEYSEKTVLLKFYLCRLLEGEAQALECQNFRWIPLKELASYLFPPADRPVLERLAASGQLPHRGQA